MGLVISIAVIAAEAAASAAEAAAAVALAVEAAEAAALASEAIAEATAAAEAAAAEATALAESTASLSMAGASETAGVALGEEGATIIASGVETSVIDETAVNASASFEEWYAANFGEEAVGELEAQLSEDAYRSLELQLSEVEDALVETPDYLLPENLPSGGNFFAEDIAANLESEVAGELAGEVGETLSSQAQRALTNHFNKLWQEVVSGRFSQKAIQQMIVQQFSGKIRTGNPEADKILQRISDVVTGGTEFAELKEASSVLIDALDKYGVTFPAAIKENFGGSSIKATLDAADKGQILSTIQDVAQGTTQLLGVQAPTTEDGTRPTKDPDESAGDVIISPQGDKAPINEVPTERPDTTKTELTGGDLFLATDDTQGRINKFNPPPKGNTNVTSEEVGDTKYTIQKDPSGLVFFDLQGNIVKQPHLRNYTDPHQMGIDLGNLIGISANEFARSISRSDGKADLNNVTVMDQLVKQSIMSASQKYPKSAYLAATVYGFLSKELPDYSKQLGPEYQKIHSTYHGKCLAPNKVLMDSSGHLGIVDEVGRLNKYVGTQGNIPSYDTWCGPQGPNDKAPKTLLGTYCFMHDIGYDELGYFNIEEDMKLISRISQNFTRMGYQERAVAQVAVQWFANVGMVLGALKTKYLPDNIDKVVNDTGTGGVADIYSQLVPESVDTEQLRYGRQKATTERDITRTSFYQGIRQGVEQIEKQTAGDIMGGGQTPTSGQLALWTSFMNLGIVSRG